MGIKDQGFKGLGSEDQGTQRFKGSRAWAVKINLETLRFKGLKAGGRSWGSQLKLGSEDARERVYS